MTKQSLQDQLMKAGLVSENKAKQVRSEKRKQNKQRQQKKPISNELEQSVRLQKSQQAEKDRTLNEQHKQQSNQQQVFHQIKQLLDQHAELQSSIDDGVPYHFSDQGKVKTLYLEEPQRKKIIAGNLAIINFAGQYHLIPTDVAAKIKLRDENAVIVWFKESTPQDAVDDYPGYEIPDDMMW